MIQTGFESRLKIQDSVSNQLPNYVLEESPLTVDFLKQYYISQEYQGGPVDIAENLDQYLNLDNLTPDVVIDSTTLSSDINESQDTINVSSTKGFPKEYGLLKIDSEVITYTGITTVSFTGCRRGFSGITSYHRDLNQEELVFSESTAANHTANTSIQNLSSLFLKEFYKKTKYTFTPGLENTTLNSKLDAGSFIKESKSLYKTKGTNESFRILFNALYGIEPDILNLEEKLIKPSFAKYTRRQVAIAEVISGDALQLKGQSLFKSDVANDINASISEIEPFERYNSGSAGITTYYKVGLFVGYDEISDVEGDFVVIPNTKSLESVAPESSSIIVDSTVGFNTSGTIISGVNTITYTDKTVNQFLNCTWNNVSIADTISPIDNIRSEQFYFGYENGDSNKKVVLRFTGVLSNLNANEKLDISEGDIISVKSIGDKISNPEKNKTYKEVFANSWIYNTSSSYHIKSFSPIKVDSSVDRSSLKFGDYVEITDRESNKVVYPTSLDSDPYVSEEIENNEIILERFTFSPNVNRQYNIRRKINKANSSGTNIQYGNDNITSDIQNVYVNENSAYVASNSLPSYRIDKDGNRLPFTQQITVDTNTISFNNSGIGVTLGFLTGFTNDSYSIIDFGASMSFEIGDRVYYEPQGSSMIGLETGSYYVNPISNRQIKIYGSNSGIKDDKFITFNLPPEGDNSHKFTIYSQRSNLISPQKLIKKFPLSSPISTGIGQTTISGGIGMLINGVEIENYKSDDKIYYGPLEKVDVINRGSDFDVINPPKLIVSSGAGTTALVQPVLKGSITKVYVDSQDFDIDKIVSIGVSGGNGNGCILDPIIGTRSREVLFNAAPTTQGGGINTSTEQIVFLTDHDFVNEEPITYDSNLNPSISIGVGTDTLLNNSVYFPRVSNNRTIRLFNTLSDCISGINTIDFNGTNSSGIHKFKVSSRQTLTEVRVINGGKDYTNRKLIVKPSAISIAYDTITFKDHGFSDGELIKYSSTGTIITGLTTTKQYQVIKIDSNSFRVADAGIGGTITSNYIRKNYLSLDSVGTGYHNFQYPDITGFIEFTAVGVGTTSINITPVVKGDIDQVYVYESGTGYGTTITNVEENPIITVKTGKEANLRPIVLNGQINSVNIDFGGIEYFSNPDLIIIDENGTGAELRPIIENEKIVDVKVTNPGIGYSTSATIVVKSSGINQSFRTKIRSLTPNKFNKFGKDLLIETTNNLKYSVCGYTTNTFQESNSSASGIIGWAYDGNPIYGPYGYEKPDEDPSNITPGAVVKRLVSGYTIDISNVVDRPSGFETGYFVEDYTYSSTNGDLDEFNGRYEKNSDFPNGVYAYHAVVTGSTDIPTFPYFIGDTYRSSLIPENILETDQISLDYNELGLLRNTFPYKVSDFNASNDFLTETNSLLEQEIEIESISSGSIDKINILNSGSNYKVDDVLEFDNTGTKGSGLISKVLSVEGKKINEINTSIEKINSTILTWSEDKIKVSILPRNNLSDGDNVVISGLSTNVIKLKDSYSIGITSTTGTTISTITASPSAGFTTEIYVSRIPSNISIGSSIGIGTETLKVLNVYNNLNILRVKRDAVSYGKTYAEGSEVSFIPDSFTIDEKVPHFKSELNDLAYFNPIKSVGIGTTEGTEYPISFAFGGKTIQRNVPIQHIYIENHPFKTNQKIKLTIPSGGSNINISTDKSNNTVILPTTLYAVNKTINSIGIKTTLNSNEIYFRSFANNNNANKDEYLFETEKNLVNATVERIKSKVSISTSHGLLSGDVISLSVKPDLSVGIGTSTSIKVLRETNSGNILINPIPFTSGSVKHNKLGLGNHGFKTGDKVFYDGDATGLSTGSYYVYKIDDDFIQLGETLYDVNNTIKTVSITQGTGGSSQSISRINPQIKAINNNNLVFDLSDSSLSGYNFNLYYDKEYNNKFVSTGSTNNFSVSNVGTALTVGYSTSLPNVLYYNIDKSGFISTSDFDVSNNSEIVFSNSYYNGSYPISGVAATTFDIFLNRVPENLTYKNTDCDELKYTSKSKTIEGGIDRIDIISGGSGYKSSPKFIGVGTIAQGKDASVVPTSSTIGKVNKIRVINDSYEYSSDPTLQPEAFISPIIEIENASTIGIVSVTNGGSGYISDPNIIIVNSDTGTKIDSGYLQPNLLSGTIIGIDIEEKAVGLPENTVTLKATNNTNGITITKVESHAGTAFTCTITTPILGFGNNPFTIGDKVYIEGIEKYSNNGSGFNSEDYGYKLLTVSNYDDSGAEDKVTIDVSSLTTNTGIARTISNQYSSIISESKYPTFFVSQVINNFDIGEKLLINSKSSNLSITESSSNILKIKGTDDINVGDVLLGETSSNQATIKNITENNAKYNTGFSILKEFGWVDTTGKLNDDGQLVADNDYYQNLSYSVKSTIPWDELKTPVNNLLHTSGLKNFADVGIVSTTNIGIGSTNVISIIYDIIDDKRVDTVNYIDMVVDKDTTTSSSRFIDFENIRLSDYIQCKTNECLLIDDISSSFSNLEASATDYLNVYQYGSTDIYNNYLIRVNSASGSTQQLQLSELVVLSNGTNNIMFEKSLLINSDTSIPSDNFAEFKLHNNPSTLQNYIRFIPTDSYNIDYDLKILSSKFSSNIVGVGTELLGPVDLISAYRISNSVGTSNIIELPINKYGSIHATTQITNTVTNDLHYVETYVTHNGQDTFMTQYFVDTDNDEASFNTTNIGIITSRINSGNLEFRYKNDNGNNTKIRSRIVGFGLTTSTNSTYRFLTTGQPSGAERSMIYQGLSNSGVGTTSILELDKGLFNASKSIVEVSIGSSRAVHEVLSVYDGTNVYVQQSQALSLNNGSTSNYDSGVGLGTFGGSVVGSNYIVKFHPDNVVGVSSVIVLNQCYYNQNDTLNDPLTLTYGKTTDDVDILLYNAIGGNRINTKSFEAKTNNVPIFGKSFDPSSSSVDLATGKFTLENHFFRANEELEYKSGSSFIGVSSSPMTYKNGSITGTLPSSVYVKSVINNNSFNISTTRAGAAVTFINVGSGNNHELSMVNSNTKSIISIDNVVQYPLSSTNITHTLKYNLGGQVSASSTIFSLSGITSVSTEDILKIDNEYVEVINVGVGTTTVGPISVGVGTYNLINVNRAFVGSSATTHTNNSTVTIYGGSYNITGKTINFSKAPRGNKEQPLLENGLPFPTSDFNGRVFLRDNYTSNNVYDDISKRFDGVTNEYTLTVGGANTTGIGTSGGTGILFVNGIFQSPTTDNNPLNNFQIVENSGISSVVFSGITSVNGSLIINDEDINANQLPRGGVPISIGNSNGLGYAPLAGAKVMPVLNNSGSITNVIGVATQGTALAISTAVYDNASGIVTITTVEPHQFVFGNANTDSVKLVGLHFTCPANSGVTTNFFPSGKYGDKFSIVSVSSTNKFSANVGTTTIPHTYNGQGNVYPWYDDLTFGSGYNNIVSIGVTVIDAGFKHKFVSADNNAINKYAISGQLTPTAADYDPVSGIMTITAAGHGLVTNNQINFDTKSLRFTCSKDGHKTIHEYPRGTDPISGVNTTITKINDDIFSVDVGKSVGSGAVITAQPVGVNTHQFVNASSDAIEIVVGGSGNLQPQNGTSYNPVTGILRVNTGTNHNLVTGNTIKFKNNTVVFKCAQDDYQTHHSYPRGGVEHKFVSATSTAVNGSLQPTNAVYSGETGELTLTFASAHGISNGATITIADDSLTMTCARDDHASEHTYPRSTDPVSGIATVVSNATANSGKDLTVNVGRSNLADPISGVTTAITKIDNNEFDVYIGKSTNHGGGALAFNIVNGGSGYQNPEIFVSEPSYDNLSIKGISRRGIGSTTDTGIGLLVNANVNGTSSNKYGESGLFEITDYSISRSGYAFKEGDTFEAVGLVTDRRLISLKSKSVLEVGRTYNDKFSMWQFGEFDYIDPIVGYQDGVNTKFPLYYNGSLISVESTNTFDSELANVFIVIINGVIQEPGKAYEFSGGTSLAFKEPPTKDDNIDIFFYKGTDDEDSVVKDGEKTIIEIGDEVQIKRNVGIPTTLDQDVRTVLSLDTSKTLETNVYTKQGINENDIKPLSLIKQKVDKVINEVFVSKKRVKLEPYVYPAARIIKDFSTSDTEFYVDNAELFGYDGTASSFGGIIVSGNVSTAATATAVMAGSSLYGIQVSSGGSGYTSAPTVSVSAPPHIFDDNAVAIGVTATATATISNGSVNNINLTNSGLGYTVAPSVLISSENPVYDLVTGTNPTVQNTAGIITGISTTMSGSDLCLKFVAISTSGFNPISVGNPIYISDTRVGSGLTSTDGSDTNVVGVGTQFVDNIYIVKEFSYTGTAPSIMSGIITCTIKSDTSTSGLNTIGFTTSPVGKYSCGKISGFTRDSSPISIGVTGRIISGLSTFPTLQRRGGNDTLEDSGALSTPT